MLACAVAGSAEAVLLELGIAVCWYMLWVCVGLSLLYFLCCPWRRWRSERIVAGRLGGKLTLAVLLLVLLCIWRPVTSLPVWVCRWQGCDVTAYFAAAFCELIFYGASHPAFLPVGARPRSFRAPSCLSATGSGVFLLRSGTEHCDRFGNKSQGNQRSGVPPQKIGGYGAWYCHRRWRCSFSRSLWRRSYYFVCC